MGKTAENAAGDSEGLLARRVTKMACRTALNYMEPPGITDGYQQDTPSAKRKYIPDFDLTGVE